MQSFDLCSIDRLRMVTEGSVCSFMQTAWHHKRNENITPSCIAGNTLMPHSNPQSAIILGPVHTAPFSYENGAKFIRFGLAFTLFHCENGAFRKHYWKRINLKTVRFEIDPFSVWTPKAETSENASHSIVERLSNAMVFWHSNSRLAPSCQLITKVIVLKKD